MAKKRRASGTGSVIEKPNGTYEGRYVVGYKENGYPITKSVFAKTKTECKLKLKEAMEQAGKLSSDAINPEIPEPIITTSFKSSFISHSS